ncbi:MAG: D-cysteine desulfhydrase family protein [Armatimonadota bacterium]
MKLDVIEKVNLTLLPTPLDNAPNLASHIGLKKLLIKRDDCTNLGMGGNKVRKLEYIMADALKKKATCVLTDGGVQSNHARLTAAASRKLGIPKCLLVIGGDEFERFDGNLLLDIVLGAEIVFMKGAKVSAMEKRMAEIAEELKSNGEVPYIIPIGGSMTLGVLGYVSAMKELSEQLGDEKDVQIVVAVGSTGTFAGCALGIRLFMPQAKLIGISVARKSKPLLASAAKLANETAMLIESNETFTPDELYINDEYYGSFYGVPSEAGNNAIMLSAQTEGLILDPVYTGKAMSGLIALAERNQLEKDKTTIFIHTGGAPGLMAFEHVFRDKAIIKYE